MSSTPKKPAKSTKKAHPRKVGRPSMGEDARTVSYHVKMSKTEYDTWKKLAKTSGKSLSAFVLEPVRAAFPCTKVKNKPSKRGQ